MCICPLFQHGNGPSAGNLGTLRVWACKGKKSHALWPKTQGSLLLKQQVHWLESKKEQKILPTASMVKLYDEEGCSAEAKEWLILTSAGEGGTS